LQLIKIYLKIESIFLLIFKKKIRSLQLDTFHKQTIFIILQKHSNPTLEGSELQFV